MPNALTPGRVSLHRWSSLQNELLWTYDGPVAEESLHTTSDHRKGYWAWLLRKGSVEVCAEGGKKWKAKAGQWMISPQATSTQTFSRDAHILSVHFESHWPTGQNLLLAPDACVFADKDYPKLAKTGTALCKLVNRHFPGVRRQLSLELSDYDVFMGFQKNFNQWLMDFKTVWVALGRGLSQAVECDERLLQALQCICETPLQDGFPADKLQRESSLGRAHLDRLFWKEFGMTTREYWENIREEAAVRSLETVNMSIKEISYNLGFKQASHFTKWFHRRTGKVPRDYREQSDDHRLQ
ncbi:MAG TPA: AraC family transcriptional regulator [Rariglobus sp.]